MTHKEDLRIVKTKHSLTVAFFSMLDDTDFDNITVNNLCERAGIRRATFYKHFSDKNDFLTFLIKDVRNKFDSTRLKGNSNAPITTQYYLEYATEMLNFFFEHDVAMLKILESSMRTKVIDIFISQNYIDTKKRLEMSVNNGMRLPASIDVVANMLIGGVSQIIVSWFESTDRMPLENLISEMTSVIEKIFKQP